MYDQEGGSWSTILGLMFLTLIVSWLVACAPHRTIPKGIPYPLKASRGMPHVYPMDQTRCLGGGIGGCSPFALGSH